MTHRSDRTNPRDRRSCLGALAALLAVSTLFVPRASLAAEPDKSVDKAVCADTYRNAQVQRKNGALKSAREALLVCASDKCPSVMQPDCTRWLTEVEAALPSVTFAAKGVDGSDVTSVRVTMDGQLLTETLDGKSVSVDPGSHVLRFEYGDEAPIEQTIIVREGEKARVIGVSWAKDKVEESASSSTTAASTESGPGAGAWIFGGVGLAAVGTFAVLAIDGMSRRSDLEKTCFGSCSQDQVDAIKAQLAIADASLAVGVVSLGVSAVLFLSNGGSRVAASKESAGRPPSIAFGLAPRRDGAAMGLSGRF